MSGRTRKRPEPRGRTRDLGFVATFALASGELVTLHRSGGDKRVMLREAVADVLALDPDAKLVSYSTPQTILDDLNGERQRQVAGDRRRFPEQIALGVAHAPRDVLHPRLFAGHKRGADLLAARRKERRLDES